MGRLSSRSFSSINATGVIYNRSEPANGLSVTNIIYHTPGEINFNDDSGVLEV